MNPSTHDAETRIKAREGNLTWKMAETNLRERKKQKAPKNDEQPEKEKSELQEPKKGRSIFKRLLIAVLLTGAISYVLTGSFLFGYQLPTIAKMKRILVSLDQFIF